MPKAVHDALMRVAKKRAAGGKLRGVGKNASPKKKKAAMNHFVFGTMTNMKKRGEISY